MYPVALVALLAVAQAVAPTPITVDAYKLVEIAPEKPQAGTAYIWDVYPEDVADVRELPQGRLIMTGPPGRYVLKLRAVTVADGKVEVVTSRYVVTITGTTPPPPKPPDKPIPPPGTRLDPMRARVKLQMPAGDGTGAFCSASIIRPVREGGDWQVLSAAHCLPQGRRNGSVTLTDGRTLAVDVQVFDREADVCWLVIRNPPDDLYYADLSREIPPVDTAIWHAGYGRDKPGNVERGRTTSGERRDHKIEMRISVSPGDSGTGFFHADNGEIVAVLFGTEAWPSGVRTVGCGCRYAWEIRPK